VLRPRLVEKLNGALHPGCRLTLVSAPAGYGKTTLVSTWVRTIRFSESHPPPSVAWLSLDDGDNDPAVFLSYAITSLQAQRSGVGQHALTLLQALQPPSLRVVLASLVNDLAQSPGHILLILDDYHSIREPEIHRTLSFMVEHTPEAFRLIVVSRTGPPLPTG
jgi:LuxR family maltose regulon positive regulatory protein